METAADLSISEPQQEYRRLQASWARPKKKKTVI
jgi:hypothetical protein